MAHDIAGYDDWLAEPYEQPIHEKDTDCVVDPETNCCIECGVEHGARCFSCLQRAFHTPGCRFSDACPYTDADECAMARERSVAGTDAPIPSCPEHP